MGYRSMFTINATWPVEYEAMALSTGIPVMEIIKRLLGAITQYTFEEMESQTERSAILYNPDEIKWYDWDSDMEKVSRELPALTFEVYMDGESSDDYRQLIAKDGNVAVSHGELVFWQSEKDIKERDRILAIPDVISAKQFLMDR